MTADEVEKRRSHMSTHNSEGLVVSSNYSNLDGCKLLSILGEGYIDFCIDKLPFKASPHICSITFAEGEVSNVLEWHEKCYAFTVSEGSTQNALINPFPRWSFRYCDKRDQIETKLNLNETRKNSFG